MLVTVYHGRSGDDPDGEPPAGQPTQVDRVAQTPAAERPHAASVDEDAGACQSLPARRPQADAERAAARARSRRRQAECRAGGERRRSYSHEVRLRGDRQDARRGEFCLALDDLPQTAGQVTPAVAMGSKLRYRLQRNATAFEVVPRG